MITAEQILAEVKRREATGYLGSALDALYDWFDSEMTSGHLDEARKALGLFAADGASITVLVGLLTISLPCRAEFSEPRVAIGHIIRERLKDEPGRADAVLQGLL